MELGKWPMIWWMESARGSYGAAKLLHAQPLFSRSAVSRYYFAAYAATHSVLLTVREIPPPQGNWAHKGLPNHLRTVLASRLHRRDAASYAQMLGSLYDLRITADYAPKFQVDDRSLDDARRDSGRLLTLAGRLTHE